MLSSQYDGVILEDKWGKTYLCSNCLFAYADLGPSLISDVKDKIYGRAFLHDLEPAIEQRKIWAKMYQQARPYQLNLSGLSDFELRNRLIDIFNNNEMWIWQLSDGWGQEPDNNGIGDGGLAPDAGSTSNKAPVNKPAAKPQGGGANKDNPTSINTASHNAKTNDVNKSTNKLENAAAIKQTRNTTLDAHYEKLAEYEEHYQQKLDNAIKNGESTRRIGAFKARLTEAKGERAATAYMEKHFSKPPPPAQMELGFGPGPGVDQIWAKRDKNGNVLEYFIVEAKGPGAKLQKTSTKGVQMSDRWIESNMNSMKNSKKYPERNQLGQDLLDAIEDQEPVIRKLVIEAVEQNSNMIGAKLQPLP
ncbi:hypothetical protein [Rheinheimera sp. MMS21-TC3]|uniref:hypothetical protein n=1 Tax=Rheinheimera sp. MMS21-TC3 TaxID=3072790 RepID=UPI0028C4CE43|nr:hypothetical protein [Rheinheimera sp. MMS21-TC3]WNO60350.1 hypothetical protein RDV63_05135 [Rheinheimera sp. MMS21-TC3]